MIIVVKANRQLRVEDMHKKKYLDDGWDIIDEQGKVLEAGFKLGGGDAEIKKLSLENAKLKEKLEESEKENDALVAKIKKLEKAEK